MLIEYMATKSYLDSIDIMDAGNTVVAGYNDDGQVWLFYTYTELGFTTWMETGPFCVEDKTPGTGYFSYVRSVMEFKQPKIQSMIENMLNDTRKGITQAMEIDVDEFGEYLDKISELF